MSKPHHDSPSHQPVGAIAQHPTRVASFGENDGGRDHLSASARVTQNQPTADWAALEAGAPIFAAELLERAADAIFILERDGRFVWASDQACALTGYERAELLARSIGDIMPVEEAPLIAERLVSLGIIPRIGERLMRRKDDTLVSVEVGAVRLADDRAQVIIRGSDGHRVADAARRGREAGLAQAFRANPALMCVSTRAEGRYLEINDAFVALTGYAREEVVGRTGTALGLFVHEGEHHRLRALMARDGAIGDYEIAYRTKAGAPRTGLLSMEAVTFGGAPCLLTTVIDITERKVMDEALRASEARFRALVTHSSDLITILDAAGVVGYESPSLERVLGYRLEDLLGQNALELVHADDLPQVQILFDACLAGPGQPIPFTLRFRHRDGSWRLLDGIGTNLLGEPAVGGIVINSRDITERASAEAALREAETRLRSVIANAPIVLSAWERDGRMTITEGRGLEAQRRRSGDNVGRSVFDLYRDYPDILASIARVLAGEEFTTAVNLPGATYETRYTPVRDDAGAVTGASAVSVDVTERRRAAEQLEARGRALEAKTREQEAFIYTVAHDLRAPLLALHGMAGILQDEYAARLGEGQPYLDRIIANAEQMQTLLDELLDLSRVGRVDFECASVDLAALVREIVARLHHTLTGRGAQVEVADSLPRLWANPTRLGQLITNLLDNAVKYTPAARHPVVRIAAVEHREAWEIIVADNGIGIPAAFREKVFGLFQRLPDGKLLNPAGTGAGLAIVTRIVETHGGTIWFDSEEGVGTAFHFKLPKPDASSTDGGAERADGIGNIASGTDPDARTEEGRVDNGPERR